jgi:hypothetical protein
VPGSLERRHRAAEGLCERAGRALAHSCSARGGRSEPCWCLRGPQDPSAASSFFSSAAEPACAATRQAHTSVHSAQAPEQASASRPCYLHPRQRESCALTERHLATASCSAVGNPSPPPSRCPAPLRPQYRHYQAMLDIFKLQPSKESREFGELATFLAQVRSGRWGAAGLADCALGPHEPPGGGTSDWRGRHDLRGPATARQRWIMDTTGCLVLMHCRYRGGGGVFGGCTCRDCPFPSWLPSAPPANARPQPHIFSPCPRTKQLRLASARIHPCTCLCM